MLDIEFAAQYLQLREAADQPLVLHQNTQAALAALAATGALPGEAIATLAASLALWRELQGLIKLTVDEPIDGAAAQHALAAILATGAEPFDFRALAARMDRAAAAAMVWYERLVAAPAATARPRLPLPQAHEEERAP